jgi:hypothetical protein
VRTALFGILSAATLVTGCAAGMSEEPLAFPSLARESWTMTQPTETGIEIGILRDGEVDKTRTLQQAGTPAAERMLGNGCVLAGSPVPEEMRAMPPVYGTRLLCEDGALGAAVISMPRFADKRVLVAIGMWPIGRADQGADSLLRLATDLSYQSVPGGD